MILCFLLIIHEESSSKSIEEVDDNVRKSADLGEQKPIKHKNTLMYKLYLHIFTDRILI